MPDKEKFLDSNVLIYAYYDREKDKKFNANYDTIKSLLLECISNCSKVHTNIQSTILLACDITKRYSYSYYDSLIISAALEANCSILYSEDMQNGQIVENTLKIVNPFV